MNKIIISQTIRQKLPDLVLGCIACNVTISTENPDLWAEIETACKLIHSHILRKKEYYLYHLT